MAKAESLATISSGCSVFAQTDSGDGRADGAGGRGRGPGADESASTAAALDDQPPPTPERMTAVLTQVHEVIRAADDLDIDPALAACLQHLQRPGHAR